MPQPLRAGSPIVPAPHGWKSPSPYLRRGGSADGHSRHALPLPPAPRYQHDEPYASRGPHPDRRVIRCDQPRTLDLAARNGKRLETVPEPFMDEVPARLAAILSWTEGQEFDAMAGASARPGGPQWSMRRNSGRSSPRWRRCSVERQSRGAGRRRKPRLWLHDSNQTTSGKPGAVHLVELDPK